MKADFELIKRLTSGAAVIKENNGFYEFFRRISGALSGDIPTEYFEDKRFM